MWIIGLTALSVIVVGCIAWIVRVFRIATRDSLDLAAKLSVPRPRRAADWPELQFDTVISDPEAAGRVLVVVRWPAHPEWHSVLMLDVDESAGRSKRLLVEWRDSHASISPMLADAQLVLRRRRTNDTVYARVVREDPRFGLDDELR